ENSDELEILRHHFTIIYTEKLDPDKKLDYYRHGINRVIDSGYVYPAVLIGLFQFHQSNFKNDRQLVQYQVISKSWKELSLPSFLKNASEMKKSFTLHLYDQRWIGKLQVAEGRVSQAYYKNLTGSNAVLQLLHHSGGQAYVKEFSGSLKNSRFPVSTVGILHEYNYQRLRIERFLDEANEENPFFRLEQDKHNQQVSFEEAEIVKLLKSGASFRKIKRDCQLPQYHIVKILENLLKRNMIKIDKSDLPSGSFLEDDFELISEKIFSTAQKKGYILVIGTSESSKFSFIETVAKAADTRIIENGDIQIAELELNQSRKLYLVGLSLDKDILNIMQTFEKGLLGTVFLMDFAHKLVFDYKKYFIKKFLQEYRKPAVIGVINVSRQLEKVKEELRKKLEIPDNIPINSLNPGQFQEVRASLLNMCGQR
ncbi:MAG: hypothetical protein JXL67_10645, partial [Calditrichaeota bacterium]|nr:hypothetical protein [Calditrichota bacterium]